MEIMNIKIVLVALSAIFMAVSVCKAGPALLFAGDSTLDDYGRKPRPPYASWGTELEKHMKEGI